MGVEGTKTNWAKRVRVARIAAAPQTLPQKKHDARIAEKRKANSRECTSEVQSNEYLLTRAAELAGRELWRHAQLPDKNSMLRDETPTKGDLGYTGNDAWTGNSPP
jgi:hypothetical protein